jgi:hypothetical protein
MHVNESLREAKTTKGRARKGEEGRGRARKGRKEKEGRGRTRKDGAWKGA